MHSYFAFLYKVECVSQHYNKTLENISIWDIIELSESIETQRTVIEGYLSKGEEGHSSRDQVQRRKGQVEQQKK